LLSELEKSLVTLDGLLPQVQIQANVFCDPRMQSHVTALYADLVQYYHAMLKFYEEGRVKRMWNSFIRPFSLRFGEIAEKVNIRSRVISDLAAALSQQRQEEIAILSQQRQEETKALLRQLCNAIPALQKDLACKSLVIRS
jgi:hypothetical protein